MWAIKVRQITHILPIDGADSIELCIVGGWPCVTRKGQYKVNEPITYVPVDSIVPNHILKSIGLEGKLAGPNKDRVNAIRLRKQLSVGILLPVPTGFAVGDDVQEYYGITKYEEPVPAELRGKIRPKPVGFLKYDVENINNDPDLLIPGEEVVFLEKIDGTNISMGIVDNNFYVCSRNLALEESDTNTYWKIAREYDIEAKMRALWSDPNGKWIHGEVFGPGIQSLTYGQTKPALRIFDIRNGTRFLDYKEFVETAFCLGLGNDIVPVLYAGPFSKELLDAYADGDEMVSGTKAHLREGVVIRVAKERETVKGDRVHLKRVSANFLLK